MPPFVVKLSERAKFVNLGMFQSQISNEINRSSGPDVTKYHDKDQDNFIY